MQTQKRLPEVSVIQRLIDAPQRFQFVQAVRILLSWMARHGVSSEEAFAQVFRFQNSVSLNFPASEIEGLSAGACAVDTELLRALQQDAAPRIVLTPTFIGLLGVNGTLPLNKTERIAAARRWDGDASAHAFVDLLSHRMVSMFFQAWGKYRLEHQLDTQGEDGLLPLLLSLAGIRAEASARSDKQGSGEQNVGEQNVGEQNVTGQTVDAEVAAYYAALLRTRLVSAGSVSRVLTHHFGVPVDFEPFIGAWDMIPENKRSQLGGKSAKVAYGAVLGGRLWRRDIQTRLNVGPLALTDVERFLPRSGGALALAHMVALFGLPNLTFEVRLILSPPCIGRLVLTRKNGSARRLGWDAFLVGASGKVSRNTVSYLLRPMAVPGVMGVVAQR